MLEYNKTFADVREDHWAAQTIKIMSAMLIANGVSDTQFAPDRSITRAEFAALIVRVLGLDAEGASPFADVTAGDWFASSVAAAYQAGIVNGRTETAFAPNQTISREEMAAMIVRAYNFK
ncbi:Endo-1,4-beta-xylanase A precursor [compost metagenome]